MPVILLFAIVAFFLYFGWGFFKILFMTLLLAFGIPVMLVLGFFFALFVIALIVVCIENATSSPKRRR